MDVSLQSLSSQSDWCLFSNFPFLFRTQPRALFPPLTSSSGTRPMERWTGVMAVVRDQAFAPDTEMFLDKLPSQSSGGSLGFAKPNTKVGGHSNASVQVLPLATPWVQPTRLLCSWTSPGKNTAVGRHFLLQGIFPTQGSNSSLLCCRQILYCLSHQVRPRFMFIIFNLSPCIPLSSCG